MQFGAVADIYMAKKMKFWFLVNQWDLYKGIADYLH